jgi:hypothetical protein
LEEEDTSDEQRSGPVDFCRRYCRDVDENLDEDKSDEALKSRQQMNWLKQTRSRFAAVDTVEEEGEDDACELVTLI